MIPADRIRLFAAKDDHFFRTPVVRAMWRRWGRPRIRWYPTSHMGFLRCLPDAVADLRGFVNALDAGPPRPGGTAGRPHPRRR